MKVLLDENLPHQLRLEISEHDVYTVAFMGWSGVDNGELLQRAIGADFAVFISNDRGLEYEQSLSGLSIAVVVILPTKNTIEAIRPLLPKLMEALDQIRPGDFIKVDAP